MAMAEIQTELPSASTAAAIAWRSAQPPSGKAAHSILHPVYIRPEAARTAAPTRSFE
jgi:hypothetical protein